MPADTPHDDDDDKTAHCVPFILSLLGRHEQRHSSSTSSSSSSQPPPPPLLIGLSAVQGAGKTVLAAELQRALGEPPHNVRTVTLSLDDFYLPRAEQVALTARRPANPLLQHRGQPGTHDMALMTAVLASLRRQTRATKIPAYDKAAFAGAGDRVPEEEWATVVVNDGSPVRVVLFEGWCVGFRALDPESLRRKWAAAVAARETDPHHYNGRLGYNSLQSVADINEALREYDQITDKLDGLIHMDAADAQYAYRWRQEQEAELRAARGANGGGMTDDEQVRRFVDGYYPAYELFADALREGVFGGKEEEEEGGDDGGDDDGDKKKSPGGRQLRLLVGEDRRVVRVQRI